MSPSSLHPDASGTSRDVISESRSEVGTRDEQLEREFATAHVLGPLDLYWRRCACGLLTEALASECPIVTAYRSFLDDCARLRRLSLIEERELAQARFALRG